MTKKCRIGIDPGLSGAMACIFMPSWQCAITMMPVAGSLLDLTITAEWLQSATEGCDDIKVVIEKAHSMPDQGVTSTFTFAKACGQIEGIIATLGYSYQLVAPQTWKRHVLADTAKDKLAAVDYCRKMYPYVSLLATPRSRKANHNLADALCMATYCVHLWP